MDQTPRTNSEATVISSIKKKPRKCQYCQREFRRHEHLQRHLRIHTHEKPYKCTTCGASFGRRDLLKRHQNIGHSPVTPAAQRPSLVTGHPGGDSAFYEQLNSASLDHNPRDSSWGADSLQRSSIVPAQHEQSGEVYSGGFESVLNQQDLLALEDLESFSHNLGLNSDWYLPTEPSITQIFAGEPSMNSLPTPSSPYPLQQENPGIDQSLSKLPIEREAVAEFGVLTLPILTVTNQHRDRLLREIGLSAVSNDDMVLPSHHSLTRFINGFFDGFYPHVPIVHIPTFTIDDCHPEIFLAMSALGAQYRHEHRKAISLFWAARSILQQKCRGNERSRLQGDVSRQSDSHGSRNLHGDKNMRDARCALLLICFATWQGEENITREAFDLQSFLARSIREGQLEETTETPEVALDWYSWVRRESERRLKLFSFAFLNLQSIAFGSPPVILSDEMNIRLPCTCLEWIAPNEKKWSVVRKSVPQEQMMLQEALSQLMNAHLEPHATAFQIIPSPLANYILLHALIQKILVAYQAFRLCDDGSKTFMNGQKEAMRNMLHAWTSSWQRAPESSLDPRNPNGPVTFTSTALLGLAYVRLGLDLGAHKVLGSRNPREIANRIMGIPRLPPGPHLLPAILHATHALSIPVRLGINFVARSHAFVWSIQHSLCGLEFAIFLSKWLICISDCQTRGPLNEHQYRLVSWISDIVEEGRTSGDEDLWPQPLDLSDCVYMAFAVVRLWARLIKGNGQWAILKLIGDGLDIYADTCEEMVVNSRANS
ncbi:hypothetical protein PENSTE_c006G05042 [Penicillium steckii]|uniref:C2H2-type domain-containing protein n=1 Tax=Penicillium steckii TaxID=303698 RepID=A0A1V6TGX8_9EURO|nr:hypothetical protein PENSTE_c006G05042 [Penicillium steckii]